MDTARPIIVTTPLPDTIAGIYAAEVARVRLLAEEHGLTLDPAAIAAEARERVGLALIPRKPTGHEGRFPAETQRG